MYRTWELTTTAMWPNMNLATVFGMVIQLLEIHFFRELCVIPVHCYVQDLNPVNQG